jgi:hypothetical protein
MTENRMKWVTREKAKVDRIACPWLIKKFVDKNPEFLFVLPETIPQVVKDTGAIAYDAKGVELTHYKENAEERVSFDAIIKKYKLTDPALLELAKIVRGADAKIPNSPPESAGLEAVVSETSPKTTLTTCDYNSQLTTLCTSTASSRLKERRSLSTTSRKLQGRSPTFSNIYAMWNYQHTRRKAASTTPPSITNPEYSTSPTQRTTLST